MAKVKFSLAAVALATLLIHSHDRKTGRENGEPDEIAPGKSKTLVTEAEFQFVAMPTGEANPKAESNDLVIAVEADKDNETETVLTIFGVAGKLQDYTIKPGDKRMITLYADQRLTVDDGADLT